MRTCRPRSAVRPMTDRPARDARAGPQYGTGQRLNPGELEEIEAAARGGAMLAPNETLAMVNTITALTRRIAIRFNQTAEARHAVVKLSDRINELETELKELQRMPDLGHLADAIRRADQAERALKVWEQGGWLEAGAVRERIAELQANVQAEHREVQRLARINRDLDQQMVDVAASAQRERELTRRAELELEQTRTQLKDAGVQIADLRRILTQRQHRIEELEAQVGEYQRDAIERTKVIDKTRSRFNIAPGEDLFEGLCRKVGDLQTSEAELVSAPLMARAEQAEARIEELERSVQDLFQKREAAEHRAARAARRLEEAEDHARQLQALMDGLNVVVNDWMKAGQKIADAVFSDTAEAALREGKIEDLRSAVAQVRAATSSGPPTFRPIHA